MIALSKEQTKDGLYLDLFILGKKFRFCDIYYSELDDKYFLVLKEIDNDNEKQ